MCTENNAISKANSGSACVNLFFKLTRDLHKNYNFLDLLDDAWEENKLDTLKLLFNARDCRGGKGDRETFLKGIAHIESKSPNIFKVNAELIPYFGRYKDWIELFYFVSLDNKKNIIKLIVNQLKLDLENMYNGESISLLAKWIPSEKKKYNHTNQISKLICNELFDVYEKEPLKRLRKEYITPLRSYLEIVERYMCSNDWTNIDFSKVPSIAMHKLKKTFMKHTPKEFSEWLYNVKLGKSKINTSQLYPHDLVRHYMLNPYIIDDVIEEQWKQIVSDASKKCDFSNSIVLSDVSSSMYGTPMEVSIALGILISELSSEPFKNKIITFHEHPKFHHITGKTLFDKVSNIISSSWGGSTNLHKVFNIILEMAVFNNLTEEQMPKRLYILSDMQFNQCSDNLQTQFQYIEDKYNNSIYTRPEIIFWNLRSDTTNDYPVDMTENNVALLSGFSIDIMKNIIDGMEINPYSIMRNTIDNERYSDIKIV